MLQQIPVTCYTNDICTEGDGNQGFLGNFNACCGDITFVPYYRADNGSCSPCKNIYSRAAPILVSVYQANISVCDRVWENWSYPHIN